MLYVGLSGGIASGKSIVLATFAKRGAGTLSADDIAREVVAPGGEALAQLREAFGAKIIQSDGALDRDQLRAIVTADPQQRQKLEAITHPLIQRASEQRVRELAQNHTLVVHEIPLLVETDQAGRFDRVLMVEASAEQQIQRAMARGGIEREQLEGFMRAQASNSQRRAVASDIIRNTGALGALEHAVEQLDQLYRWLATRTTTFTKFR